MKKNNRFPLHKITISKLGNFLLIFVFLCLASCCRKKKDPEPSASASLAIPKSSLKAPAKVLIYYSWPSVINSSNSDINKAATVFKQYDIIVLGSGLEKTTHGDHTRTKQIIAELNKAGKKVFGYIPLTTGNLPIAQLKQAIDDWKAMGVIGVFGDEFDVVRSRQNEFISYVHQSGMSVFANGFSVEGVLGGKDCQLTKGDFYLLESFGYGHGQYRSFSETIERGTLAQKYKESLGVGIVAIASVGQNEKIEVGFDKKDAFMHSYCAAAMFNFDGFSFSDQNYSASAANANNAYIFSDPTPIYGSRFIEGEFVKKVTATEYTTTTDTHIILLTDKSGSISKK